MTPLESSVSDITIWRFTYINQLGSLSISYAQKSSNMLKESSIMLKESSIMLLESSLMLLENRHQAYDNDCNMFIVQAIGFNLNLTVLAETQGRDGLWIPACQAPVVDGHAAHAGHLGQARLHLHHAETQPRQPGGEPGVGVIKLYLTSHPSPPPCW